MRKLLLLILILALPNLCFGQYQSQLNSATVVAWGFALNSEIGDTISTHWATFIQTEEEIEDFVGGMLGGTNTRITITYQDGTNDIDFVVDDMTDDSLDHETVSDIIGAHVTGNTETGITVTHQDGDNTMDFAVTLGTNIEDGEVDDNITITGYMQDGDINTFSELQSWVSDKTLVNEEDIFTIDANWVNTANPWAVNEGGTGAATFTDGGILLGSGTGAITVLGAAANGEIPIGDGTTDPQLATITAGEGIDITNGAASITIDGEIATTANKGVAAFNSDNFVVNSGVVEVDAIYTSDIVDQTILRGDTDTTSSDFVFNDAYRITSAESDSAYMSKKYIDDAAGGLVAQSVKGDHVDSTSEDFVFDDAYEGTSVEADSQYSTHNWVKVWGMAEIEDSLNEYSLTTDIKVLIEDSLDEYSLTTDIKTLIADSLDEYVLTTSLEDSLDAYPLITAVEALIEDSLDEYSLTTDIEALIGDSLDEYPLITSLEDSLDAYVLTVSLEDSLDYYLLLAGGTLTGVHDFGGATSLEIPAVADPTTDAEGEIAWDASDDAIEIYMGDESESALIPAYQKIDALIFAPDGVNDKIPIMRVDALLYPFGIEIDQVSITIPSDGAYTMVFEEWAADPPAEQNIISTVTTGAGDSYMGEAPDNDAALDADDYIFLDIPATDVDWIHIQVIFHVNDGN